MTITGFERYRNSFLLVILSSYITQKHPIHDHGPIDLMIDGLAPTGSDKSLMILPTTGWRNSMVHRWLLHSLGMASNGSSSTWSLTTAVPKHMKWFGYMMHWTLRMECNPEYWMKRMNDWEWQMTMKQRSCKCGERHSFCYVRSVFPFFGFYSMHLGMEIQCWKGTHLVLIQVFRDVRRLSQIGESTGDRPAFLHFGSSSGYNCCNPNRFSIEFELQFLKVNRIPDHQSYIIDRVNLNVDQVRFS